MSVTRTDTWRDEDAETEINVTDMGDGNVSVDITQICYDPDAGPRVDGFLDVTFDAATFAEWVDRAVMPLYRRAAPEVTRDSLAVTTQGGNVALTDGRTTWCVSPDRAKQLAHVLYQMAALARGGPDERVVSVMCESVATLPRPDQAEGT